MLSVFEILFSWAIGTHLLYDRQYLVGDFFHAETSLQWLVFTPYYTLILGCFLVPFLKKWRWIGYLLICTLLFIVFKRMLLLKTPRDGLYGTWNHAIVFWVFLSLAARKWWGDQRVKFAIKFLLVMAYFSAGLAKLGQEPSWTNGYTLQYYLLGRSVHTGAPPLWMILNDIQVAKLASWVVLLMELLSPLALLHRRLEYVFVAGTLLFQIFAWYYMDLAWIKYFGWVYLIFILDWIYSSQENPSKEAATSASLPS